MKVAVLIKVEYHNPPHTCTQHRHEMVRKNCCEDFPPKEWGQKWVKVLYQQNCQTIKLMNNTDLRTLFIVPSLSYDLFV
jgi:hypothetical protein